MMKFVETPEPIYVEDIKEAQAWLEVFSDGNPIGFDTETTGIHIINDRIKFFSIANAEHRICAPIRLLPVFKELLESDVEKRFTNCKFDMHMAANHGVFINKGRIADTICMDFLIDENRTGRHGLKETSKDYLGLRMAPFSTVFGSKKMPIKRAVELLGFMHDALEGNDRDLATQILAEIGKIPNTDEKVLEGIKLVSSSIEAFKEKGLYTRTSRTLLNIGRRAGICSKTTGKGGFIVDICKYMGMEEAGEPDFNREDHEWVLNNGAIQADMHDQLLIDLVRKVPHTEDPLDVIRLIIADYASLDAWASYSLVDVMEEELNQLELFDSGEMYNLLDYYNDWFVDLIKAVWEMERIGVKVDVDKCRKVEKTLLNEISDIEREVASIMGRVINLNSAAQLVQYFYKCDAKGNWQDVYGNPVKFWSKGGTGGKKSPATSKPAMEYFAEKGEPVAKLVMDHRRLKKIQEFVTGFPSDSDANGRIHSTLNIVGAVTGRWSSRDPNMQNIPSKGDLGSIVRELFVPDEGNTLIVCDYGQLEMRIIAHFADENEMIKAISEGKDLHSMTAALAGGHDYEEVVSAKKKKDKGEKLTDKEKELCIVRRNMKAVGFGLNYGAGATKLGRELGLHIDESIVRGRLREKCPEGEQLIKTYFGVYKNIDRYLKYIKDYANKMQYVQTISGRYRRLPEVNSKEFWIRARAERQAANSVIQGSATDIMNAALLKMYRSQELKDLGVKILLQVHDELIFELPNDPSVIERAKDIIRDCMENAWELKLPLEAEPGHGPNWEAAK